MQKMLKKITFCGLILFGILLSVPLFAQSLDQAQDDEGDNEAVELLLGELHSIPGDKLVRVAIDNPDIADVDRVSGNEIFIVGKSLGETNLRIWDANGNPRRVPIMVFEENLPSLGSRINKILVDLGVQDLRVEVKNDEKKVYIYGSVKPEQKEIVTKALEPFNRNIVNLTTVYEERGLVQVDVQILEISKSGQEELGFSWMDALQFRENPYLAGTGTTGQIITTLDRIAKFNTLFSVGEWSRDVLQTSLKLLETEGKLKVLSRPKLVCLSGKEASFLVGGEVPIVSENFSNSGSSNTSVEYKQYGISLKISPTITKDQKIKLSINTEVSDVELTAAKGAAQVNETLFIPAFTKRNTQTELYLKDQQTVFIGGLIKSKTEESLDKFPWLNTIPILGMFFRSHTNNKDETELVISLTPKIVTDEGDIKEAKKSLILEAKAKDNDTTLYNNIPEDLRGYVYALKRKIDQAVEYPLLAKNAGYQGTVHLSVQVLASGKIENVIVTAKSGYKILDDAAIRAVNSLKQIPPFPLGVQAEEVWVDVPIFYKLD